MALLSRIPDRLLKKLPRGVVSLFTQSGMLFPLPHGCCCCCRVVGTWNFQSFDPIQFVPQPQLLPHKIGIFAVAVVFDVQFNSGRIADTDMQSHGLGRVAFGEVIPQLTQ